MNIFEDGLVKGCMNGDKSSQFSLYQHYAKPMLGICLRYCKTRQDAEDVLHDGFLRVFRKIHQYDGRGSLEGWIRVIMINCALTRYKKNLHLPRLTFFEERKSEPTDDIDVIGNISVKEMLKLIQSLPPVYRLVFNLYVFEGYKHREIARILRISEGTSKSNLYDAKAIIRRILLNKSIDNLK